MATGTATRRRRQKGWPVLVLIGIAVLLWLAEKWRPTDRPAAEGGRYERFEGCQWVDHRQNDGDSFRVRLPDGRVEQFRLYFVDAPESAFRTYGGGRDNHQRIREQADAFGIGPEAAVELGKAAKEAVHRWLGSGAFTVHTEWDDPFDDRRYHGFVELPGSDGAWLHERLVEEGMVRIHTKGAAVPGGRSERDQERRLRELEQAAREAGRGGWGR